jgi:hypothetical protein
MDKYRKLFSIDNIVKFAIFIGISLSLIGFLIAFSVVKYYIFGYRLNIQNVSEMAAFGDLISGTVGAVWSVAGIMFVLAALMWQREQISIQKKAIDKAQIGVEVSRLIDFAYHEEQVLEKLYENFAKSYFNNHKYIFWDNLGSPSKRLYDTIKLIEAATSVGKVEDNQNVTELINNHFEKRDCSEFELYIERLAFIMQTVNAVGGKIFDNNEFAHEQVQVSVTLYSLLKLWKHKSVLGDIVTIEQYIDELRRKGLIDKPDRHKDGDSFWYYDLYEHFEILVNIGSIRASSSRF